MRLRTHILALLLFLLPPLLASAAAGPAGAGVPEANLAHLDHLRRPMVVEGVPCEVVWIYSEAPDYGLVGDEDEGVACVDDAARAARTYFEFLLQESDTSRLDACAGLLRFLVAMQAPDGRWYNFVHEDGSINRTHVNSRASVGWWAARAFRALAEGALHQERLDGGLHDSLLVAGRRGIRAAGVLADPAARDSLIGYDVAAVWVLGLLRWERVTGDSSGRPLARALAEWIAESRIEPEGDFPHAVLPAWRTLWHQYGMLPAAALAEAGRALDRKDWIEAALRQAEGFQRWLVARGHLASFQFAAGDTSQVRRYPQIAYGIHSLVECQLAAWRVTGEKEFLLGAGLAASWLAGNNAAGTAMYDPATGRCYDGLNGPGEVNRNSGAESTIEALLTLLQLQDLPGAGEGWQARTTGREPGRTSFAAGNRTVVLERRGDRWKYTNEAEK